MKKIAVIGGLGTLSGGDLFFKLLKNKEVLKNQLDYQFYFEKYPYNQMNLPLYNEEDIKSRKYYTYTVCKNFENKNVSGILLPCFASHSFLEELQKEIPIPIINIFDAVLEYLKVRYNPGARIGILTSNYVKELQMLHQYFQDYELIFPENQDTLMNAIYGDLGIKNGYMEGLSLEYVSEVCDELMQKGCELILPSITEISIITEQLWKRGFPVVDVNQVYADYALKTDTNKPVKPFKLGIMGGVGPSATVDFMNKIIQNTPATKDQDHIKMVVEQNPQIPDRTANIVWNETDPTIAMFSTCKRLEAEGADAIAIPCNTAHAFVKNIQEHLNIPILNMLTSTTEYILNKFGKNIKVGLLATNGTIQSKVYTDVLYEYGFNVVIPDEEHQKCVMESIYGEYGVKAGYETGICKENILKSAGYLISQGAEVIILGCTELPLLFPNESEIRYDDNMISLIDPTLVLAKKIVALAVGTSDS